MSLYDSPEFTVALHGETSTPYPQARGIRQGCPLSPYLFIAVMTVIFSDIKDYLADQGYFLELSRLP
eukprot:9485382-Prorocentrum_lima.AAC.1